MKILQLAHRLPWPPIDGGKKGTLGFVEGYRHHTKVSGHRLLCMGPEDEAAWATEWRAQGVDLQFDPMDVRNSLPRFLSNTMLSRRPFNMEKYQRPSFLRMVEDALQADTPDIVHFDSLHTAAYAAAVRRLAPKALRVLRCHNAEHVILERLSECEANPLKRQLIALQARRLKAFEAAALDDFDLVLAITDADAKRFSSMNPRASARMIVMPAGADLPPALPVAPPVVNGVIRLVHIGAMDWLPNQSGLRWFLAEVLPRLDHLGVSYHVDVVGKNMPPEFGAFASDKVTVHGFVQDLAPITNAAHLAVVPLQVGGGMRVKILDYWALGIPVLATRVGAEGLDGDSPAVVDLADDPQDFAKAIARLASEPQRRHGLRVAAFRKVSAHYGWPALVDGLVDRYGAMLAQRAET